MADIELTSFFSDNKIDIDAPTADTDNAPAPDEGEHEAPDSSNEEDSELPSAGEAEEEAESTEEGEDGDVGSDGDGSEEETSDDEESEEDETPEGQASEESVKKVSKAGVAKPLSAKLIDGSHVNVPSDAVFTVKVNGESKDVPLRTLLDKFSSSESNLTSFNKIKQEKELVTREKAVIAAQVDEFNNVVAKFAKLAEDGKPIDAFNTLLAATGVEPLKVIRNFRNALAESAREYLNMSEQERKILELEEERAYLQQRQNQAKETERQKADRMRLEQEVSQVLTNYGMADISTYNEYVEKTRGYLQGLVNEGRVSPDFKITPDTVGRFYKATAQKEMLESTIAKVAPHLADDHEVINELSKLVVGIDPTREELEETIRLAYLAEEAPKTVALQPKRTVVKPSPKKKTYVNGAKPVADRNRGLDIDDTPDVSKNWRAFID